MGIWRLLELFHRHQIGLTIFTPGRIAELYSASLREATRCGFEIANHMWEHRVPAEPELEWDHLRKTTTALEAARAFGRCFAITIHPHLVAWGGRLGLLDDVLARATSEPPAWKATGSACARWFTAAYPAATSLRLESSIWTDHPGSLS